jgi:hypothetical protein
MNVRVYWNLSEFPISRRCIYVSSSSCDDLKWIKLSANEIVVLVSSSNRIKIVKTKINEGESDWRWRQGSFATQSFLVAIDCFSFTWQYVWSVFWICWWIKFRLCRVFQKTFENSFEIQSNFCLNLFFNVVYINRCSVDHQKTFLEILRQQIRERNPRKLGADIVSV